MAGNVFSASPLANALAQGEQRRKARSLALTGPSSPVAAPQEDADPILGASVRTQVPRNILESIAELSGAAPEQRGEVANRAADMLAERLSQGMSMRDAVAGLSDQAPPEFADAILGRAIEIADSRSPAATPAAPAAETVPEAPEKRGIIEMVTDPLGFGDEGFNAVRRGALGSISSAARALGADETADAYAARAAEVPAAEVGSWRDIRSPIDLGKYIYSGVGESLPEMGAVAGTALGATVAGAPIAVAGGAALAASTLFNTGRNIERQEEETGQRNRMKAIGAGIAQGVLDTIVPGKVGTVVGNALKSRITGAVVNVAARSGEKAVGRLTKTAATEAVTEALQQAIEIGQADPDLFRVMLNPQGEEEMAKADELLDEFINSALLGAAAGGVFGTAEVAATPGLPQLALPSPKDAKRLAIEGPARVLALPAPNAGGAIIPEAQDGQVGPIVTPPPNADFKGTMERLPGPLERAAAKGPAPLAPDMEPGAAIHIDTPDAGTIEGVFVSEDPQGIRIRADGQDLIVPRDEIEAGAATIRRPEDAPPTAEPSAEESPAIPEGPAEIAEGSSEPDPIAAAQLEPGPLAAAATPDGPAPALEEVQPSPDDIRARLVFVAEQGRTSGWNRRLIEERQRLEAQLAALEPSPANPSPEPVGEVAPEASGGSLPVAPEAGEPVTTSEEGGAADAGPSAPPAIPETPQVVVQPAADPTVPPAVGEGAAAGAVAPALTVEPIRTNAAIVRGAGPDAPPVDVPGVTLKWDERAGGWIFPRKHIEKVQAALGAQQNTQGGEEPASQATTPTPAASEQPGDQAGGQVAPPATPRARREAKAAEAETRAETVRSDTTPIPKEITETTSENSTVSTDSIAKEIALDTAPPSNTKKAGIAPADRAKATPKPDSPNAKRAAKEAAAAKEREAAKANSPRARREEKLKREAEQQEVAAASEGAHTRALPDADKESLRRGRWTKAALEARLRDGGTAMDTGQYSPEARRWLTAERKREGLEVVAHWAAGNTNQPVYRLKGVTTKPEELDRIGALPYRPVSAVESSAEAPEAEAKPLYVERKVSSETAERIVAWAREQGFKSTLRPDDMHITVAFSRDPVAAPAETDARKGAADKVEVKKLGEAVVLAFPPSFLGLDRDHQRYRDAGASWDHPSYIPHVTITYQPGDVDIDALEPFVGEIELGPEAQSDLDTNAVSKVEEVPTGSAVRISSPAEEEEKIRTDADLEPGQPRDDAGRFTPREESLSVEVADDGTATIRPARFVSADALRHFLAGRSDVGPVVSKLIDAGKVVLHDTAETLPGGGHASVSLPNDAPVTGLDAAVDAIRPGAVGRDPVVVGGTPAALKSIGVPDHPVVIAQATVGKALAKHRLTHDEIKAALRGLYDPVLVFDSSPAAHAPDDSLVVVVEVMSQGEPVALALHVAKGVGRGALRINDIATLGTRRSSQVQLWLDNDLLRLMGRKASAWVRSVGLRLPKDGSPKHRRMQKVARWTGAVKKSDGAGRIQGLTTPDGTIHLVAANLNESTAVPVLLHESFHAGAERLIGTEAWAKSLSRLDRIMRQRLAATALGADPSDWFAKALDRLQPGAATPEEMAAYAIEERAAAPVGLREIAETILGRIKAFLLRRFGAQVGEVTPAQMEALALAALRSTPLTAGPRPGGNRMSVAAAPALSDAQAVAVERSLVGHALTKAMAGEYGLLSLVPGEGLFAEMGAKMPAAQNYLRVKEEMDAVRTEWHQRADDLATEWRDLGLTSDANREMMDLMHEATLAGTDPSETFSSSLSKDDRAALAAGKSGPELTAALGRQARDQDRAKAYTGLKKRFTALPEAFQEMFRKVRDSYVELDKAFEAALLENVGKALDINLKRAERDHEAELERIRDEGLTGKEKGEAVAVADKLLASARKRHEWGKGARMQKLRVRFESEKIEAPYFPLFRVGDYFVTTRDKETGAVTNFSRFESPKEQADFANEQSRDDKVKVEIGVLGERSLRDLTDPAFVADVEEILGKAGVEEKVLDQIWQRWLETLPDMSIRKSKIHRKGTPGYSGDAYRAFGHHLFHGSHQLARLRYSMDLADSLEMVRTQAKGADDPVRAGLVVEEMARRHDFIMKPTGSAWAQWMTSAAFVWQLAMSPAAALVNITQVTIIGIPVLGAYAGGARGIDQAATHLGRALRDFAGGRGTSWRDQITAANNPRLSEEEKAAMAEAYRRGIVDASQAHDLAGVSEQGIGNAFRADTKVMGVPVGILRDSSIRAKWMQRIGFFFHHAERMNREITFLAAYRMAREKGVDHVPAIETAGRLNKRVNFDYSSTARPRAIQKNQIAKVALVFKNFQINMLWRLVRDIHQSLQGATKEERRIAMTQLGGITGMMALHAGVQGVWGYALVSTIVGLIMGGDDDDVERELKQGLVEALGPALAGVVLDGAPGYLTGTDLTSRIGMPELWLRGSDRELEAKEAYTNIVTESLGWYYGMGERLVRGASLIREGEVYRGVEVAAPKAVKDLLKAGRFLSEGAATTIRGDTTMEIDMADAVRQALGFTPAGLAARYEKNSRMLNRETRIKDEKSAIMGEAWKDTKSGSGITEETLDAIRDFNERFPEEAIGKKELKASFGARKRWSDRNEDGVVLDKDLAPRLRGDEKASVYGE